MKNIKFIFLFYCLSVQLAKAQQNFTLQDTLRGSITKERSWWDLKHYKLFFDVDINNKYLSGSNVISFEVLRSEKLMQIDLQEPMKIQKIIYQNKPLKVIKNGAAHIVHFDHFLPVGSQQKIKVFFSGHPLEAPNAPWDGGFSWKKDNRGNDFVATSCQTKGASLWWPCKDHMYDEPDNGALITVSVPKNLMAVSNGRLIKKSSSDDNKKSNFVWKVTQPINNYGINLNIGNYTEFHEYYKGVNGNLDCNYYVLKQNHKTAKKHFKQVKQMLEAFEFWFGPYPFYEDSYKLVEVPYLGMEHQSSVTYGNRYQNGYLGRDLSRTGWGLKFDFIIIHESGHEWFANSITNKDVADMWIHESFTAYSESLYLEYFYGYNAARDYLFGTRKMILNDEPIIGQYNVNKEGSSDMYYKGANLIHMIRFLINDDMKWHQIFKEMQLTFRHRTVETKEIESFIQKYTNISLSPVFDQYLRTKFIPVLEYKIKENAVKLKLKNCIEQFEMPIRIKINGKSSTFHINNKWRRFNLNEKIKTFDIPKDYLLDVKPIN